MCDDETIAKVGKQEGTGALCKEGTLAVSGVHLLQSLKSILDLFQKFLPRPK